MISASLFLGVLIVNGSRRAMHDVTRDEVWKNLSPYVKQENVRKSFFQQIDMRPGALKFTNLAIIQFQLFFSDDFPSSAALTIDSD